MIFLHVLLMTNKSRGRKNRKGFQAIPFDFSLSLSTLASDIVITSPVTANFTKDLFGISIDAQISLQGSATAERPISVGFAHGDLSVTEIKEALNAELNDPSNIVAREHARRPVRRTGTFADSEIDEVLNRGVKIRTPLRFTMHQGHGLNGFVHNRSGATLTTGAVVKFYGTLFGRWS